MRPAFLKTTGAAPSGLQRRVQDEPVLHNILRAVFSDCRKFYPNRAMFDADYRLLQTCTLGDLYNAWKAVNASLCSSDIADSQWLSWRPTDPQGIRAIRQLLGIFTRLEGVCEDAAALDAWKHRVSTSRARVRDTAVLLEAQRLVSGLLGPAPSIWELIPRHGSGSVATGEKSWQKWKFTTTYAQLETLVGGSPLRPTPLSADLFFGNASVWAAGRGPVLVEKHPITKVIAVPKDLSKPRIISEEPLSLMFLQQGLMRWIYRRIERRTDAIKFTDQTVNALTCKEYLAWASLDLSDASDLVSRTIVRQLMPNDWWRLLSALRSHFGLMPDGTVVPLRAFTPMGNALCFPIESIVFYAIVSAYLRVHWKISDTFVYGDDILVPVAYAEEVLAFLLDTGMRPNLHKCCYKAKFRESCGAEWFDYHDITVARPRSFNQQKTRNSLTAAGQSTSGLPLVELAGRLYNAGFLKGAQAVADLVTLPVHPGVGPGFAEPALRWKNVGLTRWHPGYQRWQRRIAAIKPPKKSESPDGWISLNAYLTSGWSSRHATSAAPVLTYAWVGI